ncbi:hypothetical protein [Rhodococcus sp. RS1C4]|nr:hypothetical protein [Rhodococcus sp. RS1C4]
MNARIEQLNVEINEAIVEVLKMQRAESEARRRRDALMRERSDLWRSMKRHPAGKALA